MTSSRSGKRLVYRFDRSTSRLSVVDQQIVPDGSLHGSRVLIRVETDARSALQLKVLQRSGAGCETIDFKSQSLEHRDVEIRERLVVVLVQCDVLAMVEAAAGEDGRQIAVVMTAAVHVRPEQHHRAVEQARLVFPGFFQTADEVSKRFHMLGLNDAELLELF